MPDRLIEAWLDRACAPVRSARRRAAIRRELLDHIEDRIRQLRNQGMDAEQAVQLALAAMGDPDAVARALAAGDRPWRRFLGWLVTLFFWTAALALLLYCVLSLLHVI